MVSGTFNIADIDILMMKKALVAAENGFFRFDNLKEHVTYVESIDHFIETALSRYTVEYRHEKGKGFESLNREEVFRLLVSSVLPDIRKIIDKKFAKDCRKFHL